MGGETGNDPMTSEELGMVSGGFDLADRVAVITGGGTGIGQATALLLAEHGSDIVVASRRTDNLERTAEKVRTLGRRVLTHRTDVRKPAFT